MGLDRRPELVAHLMREWAEPGREETTEKVTFVEKAANVVREAFIKCLSDRSGTPGPHGKPEGKRMGIYLTANLCLKLLFKVGWAATLQSIFPLINRRFSVANYETRSKCLPVLTPNPPHCLIFRLPKG
jgi:hypothetical protein